MIHWMMDTSDCTIIVVPCYVIIVDRYQKSGDFLSGRLVVLSVSRKNKTSTFCYFQALSQDFFIAM